MSQDSRATPNAVFSKDVVPVSVSRTTSGDESISVSRTTSGPLSPYQPLPTSVCGSECDRPGAEDVAERGARPARAERSGSHCGPAEGRPSAQKLGLSESTGTLGGAEDFRTTSELGERGRRPSGVGALAPTETDISSEQLDSDLFPDEGELRRADGVITSGLPDRSESAIEHVLPLVDEPDDVDAQADVVAEQLDSASGQAMVQIGEYVGPLISESDKYGIQPKKLTHRMKYVAHLAAMGMSNKDIAVKAGYTTVSVARLLNTPEVSIEVERARQAIFKQDPDTSLRVMIPKALSAIGDVLDSPEEKKSLKVDTAFRLLERTHGKPKQSVDVGGNVIRDLFELLDRRDDDYAKSKAIHASGGEVVDAEMVPEKRSAEPVNKFDDVLDEFSVGVDRGGDVK